MYLTHGPFISAITTRNTWKYEAGFLAKNLNTDDGVIWGREHFSAWAFSD